MEFEKNSVSGLPATVCVNTGCNRKLIMQVTNLKNEKRLLLGNDCEGGLLPEAEVCMTGGTSDKFGWRFRYVHPVAVLNPSGHADSSQF